MFSNQQQSIPEMSDRHLNLLAIALILMALKFAVTAVMLIVDESHEPALNWAETILALCAVVLVLPIMWKLALLETKERRVYFILDSFTTDILNRAMRGSWYIVWLYLIVVEIFARRGPDFPAGFYLNVTLFLMGATAALIFLFLANRETGEE